MEEGGSVVQSCLLELYHPVSEEETGSLGVTHSVECLPRKPEEVLESKVNSIQLTIASRSLVLIIKSQN